MTYWFKPRRYGYGATPISWQGWFITASFAALIVIFARIIAFRDELTNEAAIAGAAGFVAVTLAFIWIAWKKTDGAWRWRWGSE